MPLPSSINDLSQTAGSNSPSGSEAPSLIDDYLRTYASYIAQHRDGKGFALEASVASAATCDIGAANSLVVQITGTTGITSFGTTYSGPRIVRFAAALTLTHSASLVLPGAANITTAAGDALLAVPNGNPASGYRVVAYQRANGQALSADLATATGVLPVANGGTGQTTAAGIQSILPVNQTRVDVASAATVNLTTGAANTDHINITGTTGITLFTVAAGRLLFVRFAGALTLTNNANIVTQTGQNIITQAGDTCILRATAANVVEVLSYSGLSRIVNSTSITLTSQTAVDFTGIPPWAKRINIMLVGVSTSGTSLVQVQIGSTTFTTSGYLGSGVTLGSTNSVTGNNNTSGFLIEGVSAGTVVRHGIITLQNVTGNTWVMSSVGGRSEIGFGQIGGGTLTLGGVLDRVRITTIGGTDTFDAGSVNISWE